MKEVGHRIIAGIQWQVKFFHRIIGMWAEWINNNGQKKSNIHKQRKPN